MRRKAGFLTIALTTLVSCGVLVGSHAGGKVVPKKEWVEVEQVDNSDLVSVEEWAKGICRGVSVKEAAEALNVDPTLSAVVNDLTESLPESTRRRAAEICRAELIT